MFRTFRGHDRISYTYRPDSDDDLVTWRSSASVSHRGCLGAMAFTEVLQGWVLTAPAQFQIAMTEGEASCDWKNDNMAIDSNNP